jgi:hypothetical protein
MRTTLALLFALSTSGCVLSHSIAVTPTSLPVPPEAQPTRQVSSKGCTMFIFGFLPVSGQSNDGLKAHSAYNLIQDASGGLPLAGVTIEEWQRMWFPIGLSHCTHVNGRLMEVPSAKGKRRRAPEEDAEDEVEPAATQRPEEPEGDEASEGDE